MGWTGHKKPKAQDYRQWLIDAEVPFPSNTAIEALCELIVQHQPGQHAEEGAQPSKQKQRKKKGPGQGKPQPQQQQERHGKTRAQASPSASPKKGKKKGKA